MTTELDRLLTPEPEYPRDDWSRGRNQLRESVRPEVEALQARVRELEGALKTALEHVEELEEAWQRGVLVEHDGLGGTRSNRNHDVGVALRATLEGKD